MTTITTENAAAQVLAVLREAIEGPPEEWSYFTDNARDAGWLGTLERVGAADASRLIGGTSIAAHVHHATFAMDASTAWIRREWTPRDWKESWRVQTVDEAEWRALLARLRAGYEALLAAIEAHGATTVESFGGAVGAVAHAAYHLGAIRQKVGVMRRGAP